MWGIAADALLPLFVEQLRAVADTVLSVAGLLIGARAESPNQLS